MTSTESHKTVRVTEKVNIAFEQIISPNDWKGRRVSTNTMSIQVNIFAPVSTT